jgi:predicted esterase
MVYMACSRDSPVDIFKASIRYQMDHIHTYDFVEGTYSAPLAPELRQFFPSEDAYFNYFELDSVESMSRALDHLEKFLELEGPYDGVIAFSQGACLVATYLIQQKLRHPQKPLPFKCAIFFSGAIPLDPEALEQGSRDLMAGLPTAHIWGRNDTLWPGTSDVLYALSDAKLSSIFLHDEGHSIPAARSKQAVSGSVKSIRRAVDRATLVS